jgi:anaerobic carbon-monoxide dehydrogenase iron sulfur subunit
MSGTDDAHVWILKTPERCSGCRLCEVVCTLSHEGTIWPEAARIRVFERFPGACTPITCVQCDTYPCVAACPVSALSVNEDTGAVMVDDEACIRCGKCVSACPGTVPRLPEGRESVLICDLCGGDPACVKICQQAGHGALESRTGRYRPVYRTFAEGPVEQNDALAANMYGKAIEVEETHE